MCRYRSSDLIKYEDAIVIHFDETGAVWWITLKNYGLVFHSWSSWAEPWTEIKEIMIGVPAGQFKGDEAGNFLKKDETKNLQIEGRHVRAITLNQLNKVKKISISAMLDAVDVINLQVRLLQCARVYSYKKRDDNWTVYENNQERGVVGTFDRRGATRREILQIIFDSLNEQMALPTTRRGWLADTYTGIYNALRKHGPLHWIGQSIMENKKAGYTAYFPLPSRIIEEQRTRLKGGEGKTLNEDMRDIRVIPAILDNKTSTITPKSKKINHNGHINNAGPIDAKRMDYFSYDDFFKELDKDRLRDEGAFLAKGIDRKPMGRELFPNAEGYLHSHINRIDCFAFRGDDRSPSEIKKATGFLPGVTRTDRAVQKYRDRAQVLDALKSIESNWANKDFRDAMRNLDVFTLGAYTDDPDFKGFISGSTSTAIAKHFANEYSKGKNVFKPTNCFAIRCKKGFHLPTDRAALEKGVGWYGHRDAKNVMSHHAEHEVATPGVIDFVDIVGMRVLIITTEGQFFSGPVFMQDALSSDYGIYITEKYPHGTSATSKDFLTKEITSRDLPSYIPVPDDHAFSELFQLFSGKNQGMHEEIEFSYKRAPFDVPDFVFESRSTPKDAEWRGPAPIRSNNNNNNSNSNDGGNTNASSSTSNAGRNDRNNNY